MSTGSPAAAVPRVPFTVGGRYVAERVVAVGGGGSVYAGRDAVLDRPVAVKILRSGTGPNDQFLREARAAAALKHPNIVDVYDAGIENGYPYIVMEFVAGDSLKDVIGRDGRVEPARAANIAATVADALSFAHQQALVHCDIKPANILLTQDGRPKLVDFGIAQRPMTGIETDIVGTAEYIAPEQVEGGALDGRVDVYSLAAVLYHMLTGVTPHPVTDLEKLDASVFEQPVRAPSDLNSAVPAELSAAVMRGLAVLPAQRYATASEFSAALRTAISAAGQQVTRRIGIPAAEPVPLPSIGVPSPKARTSHRPSSERGVSRRWPIVGGVLAGILVLVTAGALLIRSIFGGDSAGSNTLTVAVPNVVNQRLDDAAERLRAGGLVVSSPVNLVPGKDAFGVVISQEPAAGTSLARNAEVRLTVSLGSE